MTSWFAPGDLLLLGLSVLRHFAIVLALAAFGFSLGASLTRGLLWESALEKAVLATALGLALLGHLLLGFGLLGLFSRTPLAIALGVIAVTCLHGWKELMALIRDASWVALRREPSVPAKLRGGPCGPPYPLGSPRYPLGGPPAPLRPRRVPAVTAGVIFLVPMLLLPQYPPTAFDATMYHLPYAKAFVTSGGVPFLPSLRFPVFPQLGELLFGALMLWSDDVAAQCLQTLWTVLTAVLLFVWGRRAFSQPAGGLAAALFLGGPIVVYLCGTAYVEPALVLFSMAAVYAFGRWRRASRTGWLALAAAFAGSAAAVKYLGLFWVALLGFAVLVARIPERRSRAVAVFFGLTAALLLPWYARIATHTGNPVFPYMPGVFGVSDWDLGSHQPRLEGSGAVLSRLVSAARLPWDLVFARERFGWHPPFSPFYIPGVLLALLAAVRDAHARRCLLVCVAYALFVSFAPPDPRYLIPAAALLALPAGAGTVRLVSRLPRERWRRGALFVAAILLLLPGWLYGLRHAWWRGPVPVTAERREEFLSHLLPAYPAIRRLNAAHGDRYVLYAFFAENMPYFAAGGFWGDWFGPGTYERVLAAAGSAESLHQALRALGATHLLVLEANSPKLPFADPRFPELFRLIDSDARGRVFALNSRP